MHVCSVFPIVDCFDTRVNYIRNSCVYARSLTRHKMLDTGLLSGCSFAAK